MTLTICEYTHAYIVWVWRCLCVVAHMCGHMHIDYLHACWAQRIAWGSLTSTSHLVFCGRVSDWHESRLAAWLTSLRDWPRLCLPNAGITSTCHCDWLLFEIWFWGLHSGPCAYKEITIPSEPCPSQSKYIFIEPISTKLTGHDSTLNCRSCMRKASIHH